MKYLTDRELAWLQQMQVQHENGHTISEYDQDEMTLATQKVVNLWKAVTEIENICPVDPQERLNCEGCQ